MGDDVEKPDIETTEEMMRSYVHWLPDYLRITQEAAPGMARQNAALDYELTSKYGPLENQQELDLLRQFGVPFTEAGLDIQRANALGTADIERQVLEGPGTALSRAAQGLSREWDPQYYAGRNIWMNAARDAINPRMSGGELENVNRGLARNNLAMGITSPSAMDTISKAITFANLGQQRMSQGATRAAQLGSSLPSLRSGVDPFQVATGRSSYGGNEGSGKSAVEAIKGDSSAVYNLAQGLMGQFGENARQKYATQMDDWSKHRQTTLDILGKWVPSVGDVV